MGLFRKLTTDEVNALSPTGRSRTCPTCGGDGRGVPTTVETAPGKYAELGTKCPRCLGAGRVPVRD
jgi:DnaJ-class molecular chaperone